MYSTSYTGKLDALDWVLLWSDHLAILFLPRTTRGRDSIREIMVRPIAAEPDWRQQRRLWKCLVFDQGLARTATEDDVAAKPALPSPTQVMR